MLRRTTTDLIIVFLAVIVIVLLAGLLLGFNRMAAQAHSAVGEPDEQINPAEVVPVRLRLAEDQAGRITYQQLFTNTNASLAPQGSGLEDGEGVQFAEGDPPAGGISAQSTNSGVEFVPSSAFRSDGV